MTGQEKIYKKLCEIYDESFVSACQIFKGHAYNGTSQNFGWHYKPFNQENPIFIGRSIEAAIDHIEFFTENQN